MRSLVRISVAAGVLAGLSALLRRLFQERPELLVGNEPGAWQDPADGPGELTWDELYREAQRLGIEGRSKMNKRELEQAVANARSI